MARARRVDVRGPGWGRGERSAGGFPRAGSWNFTSYRPGAPRPGAAGGGDRPIQERDSEVCTAVSGQQSLRRLLTSLRGDLCDHQTGEKTHFTDKVVLSPSLQRGNQEASSPGSSENAEVEPRRTRALPGVGAPGGRAGLGPGRSAAWNGEPGAGPATQPQRLSPTGGRQEGRRRPLERGRNPARPASQSA